MGKMWQVRPCKVQCAPHRVATTMQGRAWRWLTKAAGELHRLYVSMKGEAESGCSQARRAQERQAKALRKAAKEALWQGKAVDEENQAQWYVLARVVAMRNGREEDGTCSERWKRLLVNGQV